MSDCLSERFDEDFEEWAGMDAEPIETARPAVSLPGSGAQLVDESKARRILYPRAGRIDVSTVNPPKSARAVVAAGRMTHQEA